jgi:hypothetical protein
MQIDTLPVVVFVSFFKPRFCVSLHTMMVPVFCPSHLPILIVIHAFEIKQVAPLILIKQCLDLVLPYCFMEPNGYAM